MLNDKIEELDRKKLQLEKELYSLDQKEIGASGMRDNLIYLSGQLANVDGIFAGGTFEEIHALCQALVKQITFDKNGGIEVEYYI